MNKDAHLDIQADGLTMDIFQAIDNRLRRDGDDYKKIIMGDKELREKIKDFVVDISTKIDEIVEKTNKKLDKEIEEMIKNEGNRSISTGRK